MGSKLLVRLTPMLTAATDTENVSEGAQKIVDWFNKTNVKATVIVLGIAAAVIGLGILVAPKIKKLLK